MSKSKGVDKLTSDPGLRLRQGDLEPRVTLGYQVNLIFKNKKDF